MTDRALRAPATHPRPGGRHLQDRERPRRACGHRRHRDAPVLHREPATKVGDEFVIHMDRESLNDFPLGKYDVTVQITTFEQDQEIAWTIDGQIQPPIGHIYGYRLDPGRTGTHARHPVLRLVRDPPGVEGAQHLPDHLGARHPGHPRHPRAHRPRRAAAGARA